MSLYHFTEERYKLVSDYIVIRWLIFCDFFNSPLSFM